MSGHNKWSKIKHKKGSEDARKSRVFSKLSRLITNESKKCGGNVSSPGLVQVVELAKKENMPKDTIERAIKKGLEKDSASMESVVYETYGPGGCAIIIEGLTDNKNRAAAEVRHILSEHGFQLAGQGAASWAFVKQGNEWVPSSTVDLSDEDLSVLEKLVDKLEENEDIQNVYTNAS